MDWPVFVGVEVFKERSIYAVIYFNWLIGPSFKKYLDLPLDLLKYRPHSDS